MAAAAGVGLMEVAGLVLSLIGTGESTASLFTGGSDESDIVDKLETDLASVFNTQLADDEIQKAASVAQTTQTFFAIDYQNTKNQTPADRLALLNNANRGPQLTDLKNKATDMEGWARDNPGAIAQQATSLSLTIYGLIILTYRELAANTPVTPGPGGTKDRDDLLEDMRGYAATGLKQILPLYQSVLAGRLGAVGDPEARHDPDGDRAATPDYPGYTTNWTLRGFTDAWVSFGGNPHGDEDKWVMWTADWRSPEWGLINDAHAAYTRLLRTGTDDDHLALGDILSHPVFTQDNLGAAPTPEQLVQIQKTGAWLASAPRALQALRNISGQLDYVVAYNNGAAHVATVTGDGAKDWNGLGCAPRSAPSIAKRFGSSYLMAFSSNPQHDLWVAEPTDSGFLTGSSGVSTGSSPALAVAPDNGYEVVYANRDGSLISSNGELTGKVADGTSPSVAFVGGQYQGAVQGTDGTLWVVGPNQHGTGIGMRNASSPVIVSVPDPNGEMYWIAIHADTGELRVAISNNSWPTGLQLDPDTSPSMTVALDATLVIAYHGADGSLCTAAGFHGGAGGFHSLEWPQFQLMKGTSPSVAALPIDGFAVAFHDTTGKLATIQLSYKPGTTQLELVGLGTDGTPTAQQWDDIYEGTSPNITAIDVVATAP